VVLEQCSGPQIRVSRTFTTENENGIFRLVFWITNVSSCLRGLARLVRGCGECVSRESVWGEAVERECVWKESVCAWRECVERESVCVARVC